MKKDTKEHSKEESKKEKTKNSQVTGDTHLGSSNAFEETENPLSRDPDDISDEKLDELIGTE